MDVILDDAYHMSRAIRDGSSFRQVSVEEASSQKARTRARILDEAASAMREHGPDGIGVAAVMKRAGLTHGGFYAHFKNRDDLVAHAVDRMFLESAALLDHHLHNSDARTGLRRFIDYYLSDQALKAPDKGCPLPSLSGSAPRMPVAARRVFEKGIAAFKATLEHALHELGLPGPASLASSVLSEMVGAMALARAFDDDDDACSTLRATRERLKHRLQL